MQQFSEITLNKMANSHSLKSLDKKFECEECGKIYASRAEFSGVECS